jgi:type I restriction enzyme S subunit
LRFPEFEEEWVEYELRDVIQMFSGGTPPMQYPDYWNGSIPLISAISMHNTYISSSIQYITDVGLQKGSKLLQKENLLLLVRGSMLWNRIPVCYNLIDVAFNQDVKGIVVDNKSTSLFVLYWFQSKVTFLKSLVTGTGIGAGKLDSETIFSLQIALPNKIEQSKIAKFVSLLDQRIEAQSKIIEELKLLKSTIRNRIFEEINKSDFKKLEIRNLLEYEQPSRYIVENVDYSENSNLIPVLTANKAFVLGYTDEQYGVYNKGHCIIFDDFTMDMKYVAYSFKVKSSAIKILTPKPEINLRYMFEHLSFLNLSSKEHKRHYISEVEYITVPVPCVEKQNLIARLLLAFDRKIEEENSLCILLCKQKTYLLREMFI